MENVIKVENVSVAYDKNVVIKEASFAAKKGEIVAILGGNGSGKSSLLKAVTDTFEADSKVKATGEVYYNDKKITNNSDFLKKISYIKQNDDEKTFIGSSAFEHVYSGVAIAQSKNKKEIKSDIEELFEYFGLKKLMHAKIKKLSGGQRRLVSIIAGLARKTSDLIIIDEPINNLDTKNSILLSNYLIKVTKEEPFPAVVLITHCRMFPHIARAYELKGGLLQEIEYHYQTCFGVADSSGIYKI